MELLFPPHACVSTQRVDVLSNTAISRSIFTGATRTVDRTGDRFRWTVRLLNRSNRTDYAARAILQSMREASRGMANRLWFIDSAYSLRGSFPTAELISNGTFLSGISGWTTSGPDIALSAFDGVLRSTRASMTGDETIRAAAATTVAGATYVLRVMSLAGRGPMDFRLRAGTTAGGSELGQTPSDIQTPGMKTLVFTASGTSTHISIVDGTTLRASGDYMDFLYVSLSRCALVQGASQTGSALLIDALPPSTRGLALKGDRVQIGNQLHAVSSTLDSDSSGVGYLQLAWPMRSSPADNSPVIFFEPMARCVLTSNEGGWDDSPGVLSAFEFELEEALDA